MSTILQAVAVLSGPPGSWVYHLVVLFALEAAAAIAASQWWWGRSTAQARLGVAAGCLFLLRAVLLLTDLLSTRALRDPLIVTPPLDRAASALTLLIIIWAFAFPDHTRLGDVATVGLASFIVLALVVTWVWWAPQVAGGEQFFNGSIQETGWEIFKMLLLAAGMTLMSMRRKADWRLGIGLLATLLVGHMVHYRFPLAGVSFPGAERLVEVATLPLLAAMILRRAHAYALPAEAAESVAAETERLLPKPELRRSTLRQILETVLLTAVFYYSIDFATGRFHVEGSSMEPSMHEDQYVLIDKLSYKLGRPQRGDVVAFHFPPGSRQYLIKRVIGLPGETITILDGVVYVNGRAFDEPYIRAAPRYIGTWPIGADQYFVLGDNRNNSSDSHRWGAVERKDLIGQALLVYWPPQWWGLVPQPTYASSD